MLLGNENLIVTLASKTKQLFEEPKYEQKAKKNFCLWRSSLEHHNARDDENKIEVSHHHQFQPVTGQSSGETSLILKIS